MTLPEFTQLKQQVVFSLVKDDNHNRLVNKLKEFYKDDIDSDRRFEQINTIGQLLKILEIRDIVSEYNVMPLKEIARILNNNELLRKICDYESNNTSREYTNYYVNENKPTVSIKETKESILNHHPFIVMSPKKRNRIIETLAEEIGKFWRDLGRNLKIRECKIDEIDSANPNLIDKALELMNAYEKKADPERWFFILCDALEKSRRKDLSKVLQEIMAMNI